MGGAEAVMQKAQEFIAQHDLRFAVTLLDNVVAADPRNARACEQLALVYEQSAFGAENAVWRNYYLTTAQTLRVPKSAEQGPSERLPSKLSLHPRANVEDWLDALSLRLDGPRACAIPRERIFVIEVSDLNVTWTLRLRNGTLTYRSQDVASVLPEQQTDAVDLKMRLSKVGLHKLFSDGYVAAVEQSCEGNVDTTLELLQLCNVG